MRIHSSSTNLNSAIFSCTLLDMVFKKGCNLEKQREERGTPDLHLYQMSDRGSSCCEIQATLKIVGDPVTKRLEHCTLGGESSLRLGHSVVFLGKTHYPPSVPLHPGV